MAINPYASYLGTREPRDVIETTALELHRLVGRIGPARLEASPAPGKWSARDILCHLADSEIVFAFRLRQALAEDHHIIQPFDQEKWARRYGTHDADTALATFATVRNWNVALVEAVTPEERSKRLTHPERGEMTLHVVIETMAGHDLNHLLQLEAIATKAL
jgi:hypothetical protein